MKHREFEKMKEGTERVVKVLVTGWSGDPGKEGGGGCEAEIRDRWLIISRKWGKDQSLDLGAQQVQEGSTEMPHLPLILCSSGCIRPCWPQAECAAVGYVLPSLEGCVVSVLCPPSRKALSGSYHRSMY